MKIIIFVNYKSIEFNKDFTLANKLIDNHSVFLVTSVEQLHEAEKYYDMVLLGYSCDNIDYNFSKKHYKIKNSDTIADILSNI